ncbi:LysM peptidoglycan-binding domain-containing protein [Pontibacter sp. CAU 1760]
MLKPFLLTLVVVPALSLTAHAADFSAARDSVGVERKNGKLFVQHKVDPKETLYALSRKYSVPVAQIVEANPSVETTIKIGEIVLIPRKGSASGAIASTAKTVAVRPAASTRTYTISASGEKFHTVEPRQTLYAISNMYGVAVDELRRWNNLPDNSISIGSTLIVGKGAAQPTKKPVYVPEADDEMAKPRESVATASGTAPVEAAPVETPTTTVSSESSSESAGKILESGIAEMIDPKADTNKYLALHRSAPVGTIMQVRNSMNGQIVYVRVIGKLPATGDNEKVIVRISKKACQKLGAVDQKFRVDLSYMP